MNLKLLLFLPVAYTELGRGRGGGRRRGIASPHKALSGEAARGEGEAILSSLPGARPRGSLALGSPIT